MDKKIIRIPITYGQRKKNVKGEGYIPCQISGRYLNISLTSNVLKGGQFIDIDVMTEDTKDGNDRLLTRLIVTKEDLLETLDKVQPKELT